jgi:PadR family transcriptional regulator
MADQSVDLLQGTLDMMVLRALWSEPRHGYGVMRWIRQASKEDFRIEEGALYPALHRLLAKQWVEADWGVSENNRQAKFYTLTPQGRHQLEVQTDRWLRSVAAVQRVLKMA